MNLINGRLFGDKSIVPGTILRLTGRPITMTRRSNNRSGNGKTPFQERLYDRQGDQIRLTGRSITMTC